MRNLLRTLYIMSRHYLLVHVQLVCIGVSLNCGSSSCQYKTFVHGSGAFGTHSGKSPSRVFSFCNPDYVSLAMSAEEQLRVLQEQMSTMIAQHAAR